MPRQMKNMPRIRILLSIPQQEWEIQKNGKPVTVDEEQNGKESVDGGFRYDVGVEAVAEIDGVDVVTILA